jgi:hypothetical protein
MAKSTPFELARKLKERQRRLPERQLVVIEIFRSWGNVIINFILGAMAKIV